MDKFNIHGIFEALCFNPSCEEASGITYHVGLIMAAKETTFRGAETLRSVVHDGPLDSESVPSKVEQGWLLEKDMVEQISVDGKQGFQSATPKGQAVCKVLDVAKHLSEIRPIDVVRAVNTYLKEPSYVYTPNLSKEC